MNCEEKRNSIFNLLFRNKDDKLNDIVLYYIQSNDISYSENKNGFFLNLSTIGDIHINNLYDMILSLKDYEVPESLSYSSDSSEEDIVETNIYEEKELTDTEIELLNYTKTI
tara:strand:- start:702 stop:1037 length:336 start_codon:yes stop_codon:yes gene_type:complete